MDQFLLLRALDARGGAAVHESYRYCTIYFIRDWQGMSFFVLQSSTCSIWEALTKLKKSAQLRKSSKCQIFSPVVQWAPSQTTRFLVLAGARRCALETCGKKKCELRFKAWLNLYIKPYRPTKELLEIFEDRDDVKKVLDRQIIRRKNL